MKIRPGASAVNLAADPPGLRGGDPLQVDDAAKVQGHRDVSECGRGGLAGGRPGWYGTQYGIHSYRHLAEVDKRDSAAPGRVLCYMLPLVFLSALDFQLASGLLFVGAGVG